LLLFLFWTVHGPFSLFLLARKRENGGCIAPAIAGIQSAPPEGPEKSPLFRGKTQGGPHGIRIY
ncbi:hypothetical protein, partial [uncultured Oscillibacter sp.]|uniref:hypothetical protein n=1 Tax=uncultured Oscillibacter sp. TaxID=876091 RepID=UPI00272ED8F4